MKKQKKSFIPALKLLWSLYTPKERVLFCIVFLLCASRALAILSLSQVIACLTAKLLNEQSYFFGIPLPMNWNIGVVLCFCFGAVILLWMLSTFARSQHNKFTCRTELKYKEYALKMLLTPRKNMDLKKSMGEIIYIIQSSTEAVGAFLEVFLIDVFPFFVSAIVALIYIATINVYVSLGALVLSVLIFLISKKRTKIDKKHFVNIDIISSKISNNINNCINNLPFIVFINSGYHEQNLLRSQHSEIYKESKKQARILMSYWSILYILEYLYTGLSLFLLINTFGIAHFGVNTLILVISYLDKVFSPVNDLGHFINILEQFAFRVFRIIEFEPKKSEILLINEMKKENKILNREKIDKIEVKDLEIEIGNFHKDNISVNFETNKLTCIVGPSGCGKTTLIGCILGLKEYKSGTITINDKYKVKSLFYNSSKIALTLQNGSIFDRSIMDNICYPQGYPNKKAKKNIQRFGLENLITRTQDKEINVGLDTILSGGEKKRISFVRAISRPADIYIFDEPTNDLDSENVEKILRSIENLKRNNIVIAITHDERLIELADNIYKM